MVQKLEPQQIVESINSTVNVFDTCAERYDVFKVETKADSSYMVVSGIQDRSQPTQRRESATVRIDSNGADVCRCFLLEWIIRA